MEKAPKQAKKIPAVPYYGTPESMHRGTHHGAARQAAKRRLERVWEERDSEENRPPQADFS